MQCTHLFNQNSTLLRTPLWNLAEIGQSQVHSIAATECHHVQNTFDKNSATICPHGSYSIIRLPLCTLMCSRVAKCTSSQLTKGSSCLGSPTTASHPTFLTRGIKALWTGSWPASSIKTCASLNNWKSMLHSLKLLIWDHDKTHLLMQREG